MVIQGEELIRKRKAVPGPKKEPVIINQKQLPKLSTATLCLCCGAVTNSPRGSPYDLSVVSIRLFT